MKRFLKILRKSKLRTVKYKRLMEDYKVRYLNLKHQILQRDKERRQEKERLFSDIENNRILREQLQGDIEENRTIIFNYKFKIDEIGKYVGKLKMCEDRFNMLKKQNQKNNKKQKR